MNNEQLEALKKSDFSKKALIYLGVGLLASIAAIFIDRQTFYFAYLNAYFFWLAIGLGGLFFTMLHHIAGAEWSVVVRRIAESIMMTIPYMAILFIPIGIGMHDLYHWSHAEAVAADPILQHKSAWLNVPFFLTRIGIYFAIWSSLAFSLYKVSKEQDAGGTKEHTAKMRKISAIGIILFALSLTFAGIDLIKSLDPHFYSTMFGVYVFAGTWWSSLAFLNLVTQYIRNKAKLEDTISIEHFHDMGKYMFGFTIFWAYIAFSQFMLIWYANLPDETVWFRHRWEHGWMPVSVFLIFGHFVVPFLILLFRASKRNLNVLKIMGVWFLFVQFIDWYWVITPSMPKETHGFLSLTWIHASTLVFVGGVFMWVFWKNLTSTNIVAIGDPKLDKSIHFVNQ